MPPHLLDLDPGRLVERKAADAGAEGDEREAARAELVGAGEGGGGGAADDAGIGRAAELHRRRVDHPARRHVAGRRLDRLAQPDRRLLVRFLLHGRTAGARDRARHPAAVQQPRVRGIGDRIDVERRDVGVQHLDPGHGRLRYRRGRRAHPSARARASAGRLLPRLGAARGGAPRRRRLGAQLRRRHSRGGVRGRRPTRSRRWSTSCARGPGHSSIDRVEESRERPEGLSGFSVR